MKFPARGAGPAALFLSFLALAVAVSGTAYAAHQLGRHNVRRYNLAPESVTNATLGASRAPNEATVPGSQTLTPLDVETMGPQSIQRSFLLTVEEGDRVGIWIQSNAMGVVRTSQWSDIQLVN